MTSQEKLTPLQSLRAHVADLEEQNCRLRGQEAPSEAAVALRRENTELRRQNAAATPRSTRSSDEDLLTLPQVARALGLSTYEVLRHLRDSLPMSVDGDGKAVVARRDVDAYLVARHEGRPTQRFL